MASSGVLIITGVPSFGFAKDNDRSRPAFRFAAFLSGAGVVDFREDDETCSLPFLHGGLESGNGFVDRVVAGLGDEALTGRIRTVDKHAEPDRQ